MRKLLQWWAGIVNRLLRRKSPVTPPTGVNERQDKLFDAIVQDIHRQTRRNFRYRARPVGFAGADVLFDAAKKFHIGARIVRNDGRVYAIYRVKKAKRRWVDSAALTTAGGQ